MFDNSPIDDDPMSATITAEVLTENAEQPSSPLRNNNAHLSEYGASGGEEAKGEEDEDDDYDSEFMEQPSNPISTTPTTASTTTNNTTSSFNSPITTPTTPTSTTTNNRQKYDLQFRCPTIESLTIHASKAMGKSSSSSSKSSSLSTFKIKTSFANGRSYDVERSLKHFEWLYVMVSDEYPGCLIPPRTLIQHPNKDSDSTRNPFLEKFIQRIVVHEKLKNSKRLYEFLTLDTTNNMEYIDPGIVQLFGSTFSSDASSAPSSSNGSSGASSVGGSGLFYSFKKWKLSSQTRSAVDEKALLYYKQLRDGLEQLILQSKKVQLKHNEWMDSMESIGRELKIFGNTDKQSHDSFHQLGDTLMSLYNPSLATTTTTTAAPSVTTTSTVVAPNGAAVVKYGTTLLEKNMEWYRTYHVPSMIAYIELPQSRHAELQLAQNTLTDLEKKLELLEKKNLDAVMVKNAKHEKAFMETRQKVLEQKEFVDRMSSIVKEMETEQPIELEQFQKTMNEELGEGLLQFLNSRIASENEQKKSFEQIENKAK